MKTPNEMPKKANLLKQRLIHSLVETAPSVWKIRSIAKAEDGTEEVVESSKTRNVLKFPLAHNVSDLNVERAARRFL